MEYLISTIAVIASVAGAVLLGLAKDEVASWLPSITAKLISASVRRAPKNLQDQYAQEWPAHVAEYPGKLTQLCQAGRCYIAAGSAKSWNRHRAFRYFTYSIIAFNALAMVAIPIEILFVFDITNWFEATLEGAAAVGLGVLFHLQYIKRVRVLRRTEASLSSTNF